MDKRNTKEVGRKMPSIPRRFHLLLRNRCILQESKIISVEMMHAGSIYENQIETFSEGQKQRIDSRNTQLQDSPTKL